jgi:hypothetical protein
VILHLGPRDPSTNFAPARLQGPITAPQKVIAAIAVDDADLVRATLPLLSDLAGWTCPALIMPLEVTIIQGSETSVVAILQWLEQSEAHALLPKGFFASDTYGWGITSAISHALKITADCYSYLWTFERPTCRRRRRVSTTLGWNQLAASRKLPLFKLYCA